MIIFLPSRNEIVNHVTPHLRKSGVRVKLFRKIFPKI
jgi:hypothetical protein